METPRGASTCGGSFELLFNGTKSPDHSQRAKSKAMCDFMMVSDDPRACSASDGDSLDGSQDAGSAQTMELHGVASDWGSQAAVSRLKTADMTGHRVGDDPKLAGA